MRTKGSTDLEAQGSETTKDQVVTEFQGALTEVQLDAVGVCFDAQTTFNKALETGHSVLESASLLKKVHSDIIVQASVLLNEFGVEVPGDFKDCVFQHLGKEFQYELSAEEVAFATKARKLMLSGGAREAEQEVAAHGANVLRMLTSKLTGGATSTADNVEATLQLVEICLVGAKVDNIPALQAEADEKNMAKICDIDANSAFMCFREPCLGGPLGREGALDQALTWVQSVLASAKCPDVVELVGDDIANVKGVVTANLELLGKVYAGRTAAVELLLQSLQDRANTMVDAMPKLEETTESQVAFVEALQRNGLSVMLEKATKELAKIRQAVTKLKMADAAACAEQVDKKLNHGRGCVACFAVLILLNNPRLVSKGKAGEGLRKQLKTTKALIDSKKEEYGDSVPSWILRRVSIALNVRDAAGDAADDAEHARVEG